MNEEKVCAVFPLYTLDGKMVGYQNYLPLMGKEKNNNPYESRYFLKFPNGHIGVWGLESWSFTNTLFVTEGIFDAARLTEMGVSAIALLSSNPKPLWPFLRLTRLYRPIVAICDQDDAGALLAKFGHKSYTVQSGKDLGDASENEVSWIVKSFT